MAYLDQLEIAERWGAVVDAAGMFSPLQSPHNLLLLGGAIMNDDVVAARRAPELQAWVKAHGYSEQQPSFTIQVLNEMTEAEKKALEKAHRRPPSQSVKE